MDTPSDRISFAVLTGTGADSVVPIVNGSRLTDLVHEFERERGWTPEDAYGGLVPANYSFGPLTAHFRGAGSNNGTDREAGTPVLGCECGEWGCWPLIATVASDDASVTWSEFRQPFRPERRYDGFGPFRFERPQFDEAAGHLDHD